MCFYFAIAFAILYPWVTFSQLPHINYSSYFDLPVNISVRYTFKPPKEVRVLCLVLTAPVNLDSKAKAVNETWGKRCDHLYFISTKTDKDELGLPMIYSPAEETYENLWAKTKTGFEYAYQHHLDEVD